MADPRSPDPAGSHTPPATAAQDGQPQDPAAIEAEIARTREQLGQTVEALGARLDVKTRARSALDDAVRDEHGQPRPVVPAVGAAVGALLALLILRRRRKD